MVVFPDGGQVGTLGGGCVEAEVKRLEEQRREGKGWMRPGAPCVAMAIRPEAGGRQARAQVQRTAVIPRPVAQLQPEFEGGPQEGVIEGLGEWAPFRFVPLRWLGSLMFGVGAGLVAGWLAWKLHFAHFYLALFGGFVAGLLTVLLMQRVRRRRRPSGPENTHEASP